MVYNWEFMNQESILERIILLCTNKPYYGRFSGNKFIMLCPYCQIYKKKVSPGDASAAILPAENKGWRYWVFNCLKCGTSHRIDHFPDGILQIDLTAKQEDMTRDENPKVQRLPTEEINVQIGKGAWLDYKYRTRWQSRKEWWERCL